MIVFKDNRHFKFYQFGRHAFFEILKKLNIKEGDKILVPSYICKDFLAPIHMLNARPIFYELNLNLNPEIFPIDIHIKAIVMVNYFGFTQDISIFRNYCSQYQIPLIEDNSHGLFSRDSDKRVLGMRGDFGIFSFRKSLIVPDGGILYTKNIFENKNQILIQKKPAPYFYIKAIFYRLQVLTKLPLNYICLKIIRKLRYYKYGFYIKLAESSDEYQAPPIKNASQYSFDILNKVDVEKHILRRRALYLKIEKKLKKFDIFPVYDILPEGVSPYCYPFYSDINNALKVQNFSRRMGLDCFRWPDLPTEVQKNAPQHYIKLWVVGFIC